MAYDYQLDFNGLVMGDGTLYDVVDWSGLEEFSTRNTDTAIPAGWGAIGGSSFVDARVATIVVECLDPTAVVLLEAGLTPAPLSAPATLYPVRWKFPNREELVAYGRVARRSRPRTVTTALGLTQVTFELELPDPRAYAYVASNLSAPVYFAGTTVLDLATGSGGGLGFDLTVDATTNLGFDFGGIAPSGQVAATNAGDVETFPVVTFTVAGGLVGQWSLTNLTTGGVLALGGALNPGDTLIVDCRPVNTGATAITPVLLNGVSAFAYWQAPRVPLALVPGANLLQLDVQSGSGTLSGLVSWQSAYL